MKYQDSRYLNKILYPFWCTVRHLCRCTYCRVTHQQTVQQLSHGFETDTRA